MHSLFVFAINGNLYNATAREIRILHHLLFVGAFQCAEWGKNLYPFRHVVVRFCTDVVRPHTRMAYLCQEGTNKDV